jgi:ketosteroid isomerase-like protein
MSTKDVFTQEVRKALSIRAVNQLIADVEAGRSMKNEELTEVIAGCIRHTDQGDLQTLQQILDQEVLGEHTMASIESEPEEVAKLRHMACEFAEGFNTGDVERIMRFYGDSYVDINLRNPVQSWQERREYYAEVIRRGGFRVQVQPEEILIRGDFAFIRGTIELTPGSALGDSARKELRYVEIAQRQHGGSWQVMWGMDGPVQEYTPSPK